LNVIVKGTSDMKKVILVGSSGHARVIADIIEKGGQFEIAGLVDTYVPIGSSAFGYTVLGTESDIPPLSSKLELAGGIVAIGDNWIRTQLVARIRALAPEFEFVSAIHPSAVIARDVTIGAGTVVMAGAIINSNTTIGDFCVINTGTTVDHDCRIENFASLCPGVTLGGTVRIGQGSFVGLGARVVNNIDIGKYSLVGAGATVIKNIGDQVVAYGTPARTIRTRRPGENSEFSRHSPLSASSPLAED
jgi:sugar O-acyltransferase (sialic acid O-acetyltransferase NeuD family)